MESSGEQTIHADCRWHEHSATESFERLRSRRAGLTEHEAAERLARMGANTLDEGPGRSKAAILIAQFADVMTLILLSAAVVSGVIGDIADTLVIAAIVVLNAALGFVQEYRAERAMAALKSLSAPSATVFRDGTPRIIRAAEVVPGDVVSIEGPSPPNVTSCGAHRGHPARVCLPVASGHMRFSWVC
jgi:Ca2+-transporting ATPase